MTGRNSIYEVFRACRLCGGGGGYKMPIVTLEDEFDMRHKIRECIRLEVHQDDKMPPLICELCVDKVNDYFEFLQMCRATDSRTRQRLGLPQSSAGNGGSDSGDCILGVTEPVFVNEDSSDAEPLARQKNRLVIGGKSKKQPPPGRKGASPLPVLSIRRSGNKDSKTGVKELKVSINGSEAGGSRGTRSSRRAPTPPPPPPPVTRRSHGDDKKIKQEKDARKMLAKPPLRSALKTPREEDVQRDRLNLLGKRVKEPVKEEPKPAKRVKISAKPMPLSKTRSSSPRTEKRRNSPPRAEKRRGSSPPPRAEKRRASSPPPRDRRRASPPREPRRPKEPGLPCSLCPMTCSKPAHLTSHMKATHSPTFTLEKLACNPCGEWFSTWDETMVHHRWHRSAAMYRCRLCHAEFKQLGSYNKHFAGKQCVPSPELPDLQCDACWSYYPTRRLLDAHRCRGEDARPGGNCVKCKRKCATLKTLKKHEEVCLKPGPRSKTGPPSVSPEILQRVQPIQVRMARVDPLLARVKLEQHYDVSHINQEFGLDKNCVYPYISSVRSIKREPTDDDYIKQEMDFEDSFVNYESYTDSDSEPEFIQELSSGEPHMVVNPFAKKKKSIDALSTLSIKAIFSGKFLGRKKIQRKRKRRPVVKPEVKEEAHNGDENEEMERTNLLNEEEVRRNVDDLIAGLESTDSIEDATQTGPSKEIVENEEAKTGKSQDKLETSSSMNDIEEVMNEINHPKKDNTSDLQIKANPIDIETKSESTTINNMENDKDCSRDIAEKSSVITTEDTTQSNLTTDLTSTANTDLNKSKDNEKTKDLKISKDRLVEQINVVMQEVDDFDMNSLFSGDLGATALKSQGKPVDEVMNLDEIEAELNVKDGVETAKNSKEFSKVEMTEKITEKGHVCIEKAINIDDSLQPKESTEVSIENKFDPVNNAPQKITHPEKSYEKCMNVDQEINDKDDRLDNIHINENVTEKSNEKYVKLDKENNDKHDLHDNSPIIEGNTNDQSTENNMNRSKDDKISIESTIAGNESISGIITNDSNPDNTDNMELDTLKSENESDIVSVDARSNTGDSETEDSKNTNVESETAKDEIEPEPCEAVANVLKDKEDIKNAISEDDLLKDTELEDISDTELDDNELMKEIDAQIGDSSEKREPEEKISLDDLLMASAEVNSTKTEERPKDNIEADINFDV